MESHSEAESDTTQEQPSATPDPGDQPQTEHTANPPQDAEQEGTESPEQDERMPDASSLLAMAAMHMDTTSLVQVLLSVFHGHAWRSMGLVADPDGEVKKDMPSAQLAIDCFAFLHGKVENTLDEADKRDVQRRLMDLRLNYVAKLKES